MNNPANTTAVKIMGRVYQIKCPPDKVEELQKSAQYLDTKVREIQQNNKALDSERLLLIAALNITHELIAQKQKKHETVSDINQRIANLSNKIEQALSDE